MAKKNGIELRELSILPGKDDILYSGNLYVDGIKIAFWKQKGDGISDEITMEDELPLAFQRNVNGICRHTPKSRLTRLLSL